MHHDSARSVSAAFAAVSNRGRGASARDFPDHAIKVVVPYLPAGTDTIARAVTQNLSGDLGQAIIVENQTGAGGRIGTKGVARAAPDGYTLLLGGSNNNAITPAIYKNLDFDPMKDFVPVAALATESLVLVVHPSVPAANLAELVLREGEPRQSHRATGHCAAPSAGVRSRALERTSRSFLTRARRRQSRTSWVARFRST
jgi:tripartite-type tricarboxylate transporter receptor subunit TctC